MNTYPCAYSNARSLSSSSSQLKHIYIFFQCDSSYISHMYNHIAYIRLIYTYTCNRVNTCALYDDTFIVYKPQAVFRTCICTSERQYVRSISTRQIRIAYISVRIISFVVITRRMLIIIITSIVTITINDNNSSNYLAHTQSVLGNDPKRTVHTIKFVINMKLDIRLRFAKKKICDFLEKFCNVYAPTGFDVIYCCDAGPTYSIYPRSPISSPLLGGK
ncbi:hypothetical protein P5V15_003646 [Pogonomyrmex californicus]